MHKHSFFLILSVFFALYAHATPSDLLHANPQAVAEIEAGTRTAASVAWWGFNAQDATA